MNLTKAQREQLQEIANRTKNSPKSRRFVRVAPEGGSPSDVGLIVDLENPQGSRQRIDTAQQYFTVDNISTYRADDEIQAVPTHHRFGPLQPLNDNRRYSKVYQLDKPQFSVQNFRAYWFEVEHSLEMNTGVIFHRSAEGTIEPVRTSDDWARLLICSRPTAIVFRDECKREFYVAPFGTAPHHIWVVNPRFCWNGGFIPENIYQMFRHLDPKPM